MNIERNVLQQVQEVRHGDAREDHVDGVGPHVLVGQHEEVEDVEDAADDANVERQVAVNWFVQILQLMWELKGTTVPFIENIKRLSGKLQFINNFLAC